ncbi:MAG: oligosaccharyl transferase, archaeosortase A system-associated [Dehalococcoidales bacterium]|nr:oligosaccharyl transferase, archaeosortase A system-associated [Dehalococcoidales bacterium]
MNNTKDNQKIKYYWAIDVAILLVIGIILLLFRILPQYDIVFGSGWVNFQGNDTWYHVRLIENLLHHFPFRIAFDPYSYFPYGQDVFFAPFFDILLGFVTWVIGLGAPTQHTIEMVAVYAPPILGVLTILPVYFIGKTLFSRKVGLLAALVVGILPTMFFMVSELGQADHHVAEVLFSTLTILFLIMAIKSAKTNQVTFTGIKTSGYKPLKKPLVYAIIGGIALGLYLLTWVGGLLFVFLIFCFFVLMFIIDYLKLRNTDYLIIIAIPVFIVPLLMIAPFLNQLAYANIEILSLSAGAITVPVLFGIGRLTELLHLKKYYLLVGSLVLGGIAVLVAYLIDPSLVKYAIHQFSVFTPNTRQLTISEVQPFFIVNGEFTLTRFWIYFRIPGILAVIGFVILFVNTIRKISSIKILLLVWTIIVFTATAGQARFMAYLTVNVAILSAYFAWVFIDAIPGIWKRLRQKFAKPVKVSKKSKKHLQQMPKSDGIVIKSVYYSIAVIIIVFLVIFPSIQPLLNIAKVDQGMDRYWHDALIWMRENTPEPFQYPDFYYDLYKEPSGEYYDYPESAYGVLSWWAYGHMITEVAHRIPNTNPHQSGAAAVARYLTDQNEPDANQQIDKLGSRYLIIDLTMAIPNNSIKTRFPNIAVWAGNTLSDYAELYYKQQGDRWVPVILYYPEYYYSMMTRLYNFNGQAVTPDNTSTVISYKTISGNKFIQSSQVFPSYEEATDFINSQSTGDYILVGQSPLESPVPLEKLEHYEKVYESDIVTEMNLKINFLKIFEYSP